MELVDVGDSKSPGGDTVPVRVRPPAPELQPAIRDGLPAAFYFADQPAGFVRAS